MEKVQDSRRVRVQTVGAGYPPSKDQDVKASKVRVGTVRCRRLMVNKNEALEAVADKVEDDIDPIPKDKHNSHKLEALEDLCHRRRYTKVHAKGPIGRTKDGTRITSSPIRTLPMLTKKIKILQMLPMLVKLHLVRDTTSHRCPLTPSQRALMTATNA